MEDVGIGDGKHYSVNVPLQEGMDDESYRFMFEPIMQKVRTSYQRTPPKLLSLPVERTSLLKTCKHSNTR